MKENQRLEWKQTWRDKFIRWICGFANAKGGVLLIGRMWNPCVFPDAWSVKTLLGAHPSTPFNPAIANVFFRSGEIETWGRGIERIVAACTEAGSPKPKLIVDGTGIAFELRYTPEYLKAVNAFDPVTDPVTDPVVAAPTFYANYSGIESTFVVPITVNVDERVFYSPETAFQQVMNYNPPISIQRLSVNISRNYDATQITGESVMILELEHD